MIIRFMCTFLFAALAVTTTVKASGPVVISAPEVTLNPAQELRAREINKGLRCVVCQNQSIDESNAPLAVDLRNLVRERLAAGESDKQAVQFIVQRYGNFVLLKPPFQFNTLLLWLGPLLLFGVAALMFARRMQRAAATANGRSEADSGGQSAAFSPDDEKRLSKLLN
jgi:cytochrome c-type biogenesis protein CcmH